MTASVLLVLAVFSAIAYLAGAALLRQLRPPEEEYHPDGDASLLGRQKEINRP